MACYRIHLWTNSKNAHIEKVLLANGDGWLLYKYIRNTNKGRWTQAEKYIKNYVWNAYYYARFVLKSRFPAAEKLIVKNPECAYLYAKYILKRRWKEAENNILTDVDASYLYARYVIKGRWPEFENKKYKVASYYGWGTEAYVKYAKNVLKGRFKQKERKILASGSIKYVYICDVIKKRYEKIENELLNDDYYNIKDYVEVLTPQEKIEFKNKIIAYSLANGNLMNYLQGYGKYHLEKFFKECEEAPTGVAV